MDISEGHYIFYKNICFQKTTKWGNNRKDKEAKRGLWSFSESQKVQPSEAHKSKGQLERKKSSPLTLSEFSYDGKHFCSRDSSVYSFNLKVWIRWFGNYR